jgi:hypothetical protein
MQLHTPLNGSACVDSTLTPASNRNLVHLRMPNNDGYGATNSLDKLNHARHFVGRATVAKGRLVEALELNQIEQRHSANSKSKGNDCKHGDDLRSKRNASALVIIATKAKRR